MAGQYEVGVPLNSGWADGDWNGDGDFSTPDLVHTFQAGPYVASAQKAIASRRALASAVDAVFGNAARRRETLDDDAVKHAILSWEE